jgi:glycosyltransferase involved in cell wall biosynthesis
VSHVATVGWLPPEENAMTTVAFLLPKDPVVEKHAGDVAVSRVFMRLAADVFDVSVICLSNETRSDRVDLVPGGLPLTRVPKPPISRRRLLAGALRKRRSLVHVRFDTDAMVDAIDRCDADIFVPEHSYMAESFLRSTQFGRKRLVVNTNVSDSLVWRATRGVLGRVEEPRLLRDELRVALAADQVSTHDAPAADYYRAKGVRDVRFLEVTLPPADQIDVSATPRRLVFMGNRDWPPNQEGFLNALRLWPRIAAGIADAELCVVGAKKPGATDPYYPDGVRDLGFVDDLKAFLRTCRAMIAPIKTGGGVRVKLLDATRMGMPVVATSPGIGSLSATFDMTPFDDDESFVAECRRLLTDRDAAVRSGDQLFEINRQIWDRQEPHRAVEALLRGQAAPATERAHEGP